MVTWERDYYKNSFFYKKQIDQHFSDYKKQALQKND